jgi:very-short-patch-repair endonuclease
MPAQEVIQQKLEAARRELLDLTGRNRLLNTQRTSSRSSRLEIVDEKTQEVFRRLVIECKTMGFLPEIDPNEEPGLSDRPGEDGPASAEPVSVDSPVEVTESDRVPSPLGGEGARRADEGEETSNVQRSTVNVESSEFQVPPSLRPLTLGQPEEDDPASEEEGSAARHIDDNLQTSLTTEKLQKRLLNLFYDARTYQEEQGVNILFLALGFLKWYEPDKPDRPRYAPLILVPVVLARRSAGTKFRIQYADEEIITNLSLGEKMKVDFKIELPEIPEGEDLDPAACFDAVRTAIASEERWEVLSDDIVLWFFSFSKFLMYRDLQSENWPTARPIDQHPLVESLLTTGFASQPPLCGEEAHIDALLDPRDTIHVTDADSSQAIAIEEVRRGRNLVIQGPPGTGKSQTITNLIAAAVYERKRILFVAEKMAALEVVKQRLDALGLGEMCLELHSHKASKRTVLADLGNTLSLGCTRIDGAEEHATEIRILRDRLNEHAASLAEPLGETGVSGSRAIGEVIQNRQRGLAPPDFRLEAARHWTPAEAQQRIELLEELSKHLAAVDDPREHVWRGVQLDSLLPTDRDRLLAQIPGVLAALDAVKSAAANLAKTLGPVPSPLGGEGARRAGEGAAQTMVGQPTRSDSPSSGLRPPSPPQGGEGTDLSSATTTRLVAFARHVASAPAVDTDALSSDVWTESLPEITKLVETGSKLAAVRSSLASKVAPVAWTTDVSAARVAIAAHGRSWFRIFNGSYRAGMSTLKGILSGPPPGSYEDRLALLDALIEARQAAAAEAIEADALHRRVGAAAFGNSWAGPDSDWSLLQGFLKWNAEVTPGPDKTSPREALTRLADRKVTSRAAEQAEQAVSVYLAKLAEMTSALNLDVKTAFGKTRVEDVELAELRERLSNWNEQPEAIANWISYWHRWRQLPDSGLAALASRIASGQLGPESLLQQFHFVRAEELTRLAMETHPRLTEFSGASHEQLIAKFAQLDMDGMLLARKRVARIHFERMPNRAGNVGQVGIVRREIQKKRQHLPLRRLFAEAGRAVQAIKPVFMMSPTSIAQFLAPGQIEFDILVIDEASQVPPVDSLGAVARAKQIVVVGDDKQLPPTRFFQKMADADEEATSADEFQVGHMESILSLCSAQNVSQRMLRWHYRSRHHSLIFVSNREFYQNQLYVIPSPDHESDELGLRFRFIENGVFDSGGTATNQVEAEAIVAAVMQHARETPRLTLGVGTFSVAQRNAILDELEIQRRSHPELEPFFNADRYEPFFVKNLENIQGDERDVILISIGYAKDDEGKLRMNFGPLSNEGGERRLNVLITRARRRCEVFSSMRADEIDLTRTKARGTAALKTFLQAAEQGVPACDLDDDAAKLPPLELQIAEALASRGYQVDRRIGIAGLFVDLAIKDPDEEGRYLLGIECDGEDYNSARSARDRDRIHTNVLRRQGWDIHRVWTIDWLNQPGEQLDRLIRAAVEAKQNDGPDEQEVSAPPAALERTDAASVADLQKPLSVPYEEASFRVPGSEAPQDLPVEELAKTVQQILEVEAPVHFDVLSRSVATAFGLKRTGEKSKAAILDAVSLLTRQKIASLDEEFVSLVEGEVRVRDRSQLESGSRHSDMLPPTEMHEAVVTILREHFGVKRDEAIVEAGRLFGFRSTSTVLKDRLSAAIDELLEDGRIEDSDGWLHAV